jgi:hypothetical protein
VKVKLLAALCCVVVLGACGGGGGGGGGGGVPLIALAPPAAADPAAQNPPVQAPPDTAPGPGGGTDPIDKPGPVTGPKPGSITQFSYKSANVGAGLSPFDPTMRDKVFALLNTPALAEHTYTGRYYQTSGNGIYEKAAGYGSYQWSVSVPLTAGVPASDWLTMNWIYDSVSPFQYIYGRPLLSAANYSYAPIASSMSDTAETVVAKFNQHGPNGYCRLYGFTFGDYKLMSEDGSGLRCSYAIGATSMFNTLSDYLKELNTQGAAGFVPMLIFNATYIYRKIDSMEASYFYYAVDTKADEAEFLAQLNEEGAKGARLQETIAGVQKSIYRIDTNCNRQWPCILP